LADSLSYVIVGRVRNVHGLKGELVIEPITDEPDEIFSPGRRVFAGNVRGVVKGAPLEITNSRPFKSGFIIKFAGIDDRNEAELWRERYLLLPEDQVTPLEEGEVYLHELEGMRVDLASGGTLGSVIGMYELPQGIVLDVSREGKSSVLIPYDHVITSIDRETRVIQIDPPDGLLD
jgi:16S rRNA processing protein RimM